MELVAWVVALAFFYFFAIAPATKRWGEDLTQARTRLESIAVEIAQVKDGHESSLRELHRKHDALIEALARMDDTKEVTHLKTHYAAILELLSLRDRGAAEEDIVKKHMNFRPVDGFGGGRGWRIPIYNATDAKWVLWRFSPYYIATNNGVRIHKLTELLEQAREHVKAGPISHVLAGLATHTRQFDTEQFPDAAEREVVVHFKDSQGKDREWPERIEDSEPRKDAVNGT